MDQTDGWRRGQGRGAMDNRPGVDCGGVGQVEGDKREKIGTALIE